MLETIQLCAIISFFSNLTRTPREGIARIEMMIITLKKANILHLESKDLLLKSNCKEKDVIGCL
jgi:hypothetical protein